RIDTRPLARWVWLQVSSENGATLLISASRINAGAAARRRAGESPLSGAASHNSAAAMDTLAATIVNGGNALTETPMKKNEPPHKSDNSSSRPHSVAVIARCASAFIATFWASSDSDLGRLRADAAFVRPIP